MSKQQLVPVLTLGDIVIMDNLGSHKAAALRRLIGADGARLWYLPPHSPDLNPIEQTFAKIKHWMRTAQKRTIEDTWRHIGDLVASIEPCECNNYFANAIRWRVWRVGAEGRAGFFLRMHRRRWPLAGPRGGRRPWPQPRRGDGRECIEFASETASACVGLRFLRAREAASPLFFFAKPVGGERWSSEELRGRCRLLAAAAAS